ncbi:MAG: hypothetical protein ACI9DC_003748 [Gammaproteobacteria bacterium]|jgi:hypothetical protein
MRLLATLGNGHAQDAPVAKRTPQFLEVIIAKTHKQSRLDVLLLKQINRRRQSEFRQPKLNAFVHTPLP